MDNLSRPTVVTLAPKGGGGQQEKRCDYRRKAWRGAIWLVAEDEGRGHKPRDTDS